MKTQLLLLLLLACPRAALAASAGADPFNFLFLDAGARPVALGGAYTALARDANALQYNPAGLGEIKQQQVVFMHNQYLQEITQEYLAYASPQGWGLSLNYLSFGSVRRTLTNNHAGTGLGGVGLTDMALGGGYGGALGTNLAAGAGFRYIKENIAGISGQGFGFDIGLLYFPPILEKAVFGAAVQNLGPDVKFQSGKEKLPMNLRLGAAYSFKMKELPCSLSMDVTKARGEDALAAAGLEVIVSKTFPVRLGYSARNAAGPGITAGLGYRLSELNFDYAFVPSGELGAAHRLSVGYRWGDDVTAILKAAAPVKPPAPVKPAAPAVDLAEYNRLAAAGRESALKQNYARAAEEYSGALAIKADEPQLNLALADALMRTGQAKEAEQIYAMAAKLLPEDDPKLAYISERRGAALFRQGKYRAAKKHFERAIELAGEGRAAGAARENAYYGLAYCLEKEDRTEEAIRNYRLALQLAGSEALKKQIQKRLNGFAPERP
ncbi:MAG TPA: PorV/PorQ family protein [Elusimicrobiales bacterium]|nr:PorV/PorQ family protein [Elusimicrobiales bacterium]